MKNEKNECLELIKKIDTVNGPGYIERMTHWARAEEYLHRMSREAWLELKEYAGHISDDLNVYVRIYIWSALLDKTGEKIWTEKILDEILQSEMPVEECQFVYHQLTSRIFNCESIASDAALDKLHRLFSKVCDTYAEMLRLPEIKIPISARNKDFIVVITAQMLSLMHGPTKSTLDRCRIMMEKMGKEILLINTAEMENLVGKIPMYRVMAGNYLPELADMEVWDYKGCRIPYVQMELGMPRVDWIQNLLDLIADNKPYQVVAMGGGGIVNELCSRIVDTLLVNYTPSVLCDTRADFQQLGRLLSEGDEKIMSRYEIERNSVISAVFTSDLKPQEQKLNREELSIPSDRFVAVVVGGRLDEEVSGEFLDMLERIMERKEMFVLFLGKFDRGYEKIRQTRLNLYRNSGYPGMVEDILAHMEVCDLYLNPVRRGGGTSAVEAMFKGVPVLTTRHGDVYVNASEEFAVADYDEMEELALKYMEDSAFYDRQSEKARRRTEILLDTEHAFVEVMEEFERRMTEA